MVVAWAGQLVYEWEQGLDEVNIYITPPPGIKANMFDIQITSDHLTVGLKGNKEKFLNVSLHSFLPHLHALHGLVPSCSPDLGLNAPCSPASLLPLTAQPGSEVQALRELLDVGGHRAAHNADQARQRRAMGCSPGRAPASRPHDSH
eukprot:2394534-Rhodomonas_salina.1